VRFTRPYPVNPKAFAFHGPEGRVGGLRSFGLTKNSGSESRRLREQIRILFIAYGKGGREPVAWALDLCEDSRPNQLVLACVPRQATLKETLDETERQIAQFQKRRPEGKGGEFIRNDTLLVPEMNWRIRHRFRELEGEDKELLNPGLKGLWLATAFQETAFRLDGNGASVESGAYAEAKSRGPVHFHFDRPFLIYLKKRGGKRPFFVMWVDNAELLRRR
jgi:hypothetical protein